MHTQHQANDASGDRSSDHPNAYDRAYRQARKQVRLLRSWYIHASVYLLVNVYAWSKFLFADAYMNWAEQYWHVHHFPRMPLGMTLGWGLGLLIHGLVVWGRSANSGPLSQAWEEQQIQKRLAQRGVNKLEE